MQPERRGAHDAVVFTFQLTCVSDMRAYNNATASSLCRILMYVVDCSALPVYVYRFGWLHMTRLIDEGVMSHFRKFVEKG